MDIQNLQVLQNLRNLFLTKKDKVDNLEKKDIEREYQNELLEKIKINKIKNYLKYSENINLNNYKLADFDPKNENKNIIDNYIKKLSEIEKNGIWVYFFGIAGGGKTHLTLTLMHQLIKLQKKVIFLKLETYLLNVRKTYEKNSEISEEEYINNIFGCDLLILDDFQINKKSEFVYNKLFELIDYFYINNKNIIFSSNFDKKEILEELATIDVKNRIISRLSEKTTFREISGYDYRKNKKIQIEL